MRRIHIFFLAALIATVSGCHAVTSPYLVGQKPAAINPEEWNGRWGSECSGGDGLQIEVLDKDKGIFKAVVFDSKKPPEVVECYLRTAGDLMFVNAKLPDGPDYHPWLIKNESGKVIILWSPDYEKLKALVEKGILPGELKGGDISLGLLKPEHLDLIVSGKQGPLYEWKSPSVLIRQDRQPSRP